MDAVKLLKEAERLCNSNKITIGEYEQMIAPLHDVEPVVRCKQCRYSDSYIYPDKFGRYGICEHEQRIIPNEDYYCGEGKKK